MVLHTRGRVGRRHFTKALSSNELGAFSLCMLFYRKFVPNLSTLLLLFSSLLFSSLLHFFSLAFYLSSDYYIDIQWSLYILCFGGYLFSHFNRKR